MGNKQNRREGKFYYSAVNSRIRKRLDDFGWTAVDLKNSLRENGLSLTGEAIRQWISGYSQPKLENIPVVAAALRCSVAYLFGVDTLPDMMDTQVSDRTGLAQPALDWLYKANEADLFMVNLMFATGAINDVVSGIAFYGLSSKREIRIVDKECNTAFTKTMHDKAADDISLFVAQQNFANAAKTCKDAFKFAEEVAQDGKEGK